MKLENLKKFNHGLRGVAYSVNGLTNEQYNDVYAQACEQFDVVENHALASLTSDKVYGYMLVK